MQDDIVLAPGDGTLVWLYDLGVRFMISGAQTDGRFALVEHPIRPRAPNCGDGTAWTWTSRVSRA